MVGAILVGVGSPGGAVAGSAPLQIRIVVVTTFPQGHLSLRYHAKDHVLGSQSAPARPVPGGPPRSWCSASTALRPGARPTGFRTASQASIPTRAWVRSAAWASHIVDGDLAYEIDGREIPADWPTMVPYDRATLSSAGHLRQWHSGPPPERRAGDLAYALTRHLVLPDDDQLTAAPATQSCPTRRPPFVLRGDTWTADRFGIGNKMTDWAEKWLPY
jgi:hypothetical protein